MKKNKLLIFFLILVLNLIPHLYISLLKPDTLLNWYTSDDAFYYFKTAQNISEGVGITFDGIAPTNGFHPLWMLICVTIFALARINLFLPLRVLIILQGLLNALSGYLLYRIIADGLSEEVGWLAAAFWMFFPPIHAITTKMGLETGINAFSIIFLIYCLSRLPVKFKDQAERSKWYFFISLTAILCLFSRLDNIFILLIIGFWLSFRGSGMRKAILVDFCVILISVFISYFARIQSTNNIFNFLPFYYMLIGFSMIIKPLAFYFFHLYEIDYFKDIKQVLIKTFVAVTLSSLLIGLIFYILHDLLHAFRGISRSVLLFDWLICAALMMAIRAYRFANYQRYSTEPDDLSLKKNWRSWLTNGAIYFLPLGTLLGGYMAFNKVYAGAAMPVSGQVKRWWGNLPNTVYGRPITTLQEVINSVFSSSDEIGPLWLLTKPLSSIALWLSRIFGLAGINNSMVHPYMLGLMWVIFFAILIAALIGSLQTFARYADRLGIAAFATGCFIHILSYKTTGYLHVRSWYWVGEMLLLVLSLGLVAGSAIKNLYTKKMGKILIKGFSGIFVCMLLLNFGVSIMQDFPANGAVVPLYDYENEKEFFEGETQPGDVIGMTGGGVIGYFVPDRHIVNLDGLINSSTYFDYLKTDRANRYLREIGVTYIYGEGPVLLDSDPYRWIFTKQIRYKSKGPTFMLYDYCAETCE